MARRARSSAITSVLVASDFSEGAAWAVQRVTQLPLAEGAEVGVLHVLPEGMPARARKQAEGEASIGLEQAALALRDSGPGLQVETVLCSGQPYVEIIRRARARDAELVVLGRHGRRPVRDVMLGTTPRRVIRKGDVPVLIVSRHPETPYRRPLVAVDLQDTSRSVLGVGLRVLGPEARSIAVVHAFNVPFEGLVSETWSSRERSAWRKQYESDASESMARLLEPWRKERDFATAIKPGEPRLVLRDELARRKADLVVLGTHARSGLAHALLGSVAEWVIDIAPCDVLVARPARFSFELP